MTDDWLWYGGRPSVDFLNTLRDRKMGGRETLLGPAELTRWLRAAELLDDTVTATADELATAFRLRDAADGLAFTVLAGRAPGPEQVAVVNETATGVPLVPRLTIDDQGRPQAAADRSVRAALARIAVDTIGLLTDGELERLRVCAADDCGMRFVDRSPARNRQWCSMRRCGNRVKARRHYTRHRPGGPANPEDPGGPAKPGDPRGPGNTSA